MILSFVLFWNFSSWAVETVLSHLFFSEACQMEALRRWTKLWYKMDFHPAVLELATDYKLKTLRERGDVLFDGRLWIERDDGFDRVSFCILIGRIFEPIKSKYGQFHKRWTYFCPWQACWQWTILSIVDNIHSQGGDDPPPLSNNILEKIIYP